MSKHVWTEIKYTPVEVEATDQGILEVYARPMALEVAASEAVYGCWFCLTGLSINTLNSDDCPGTMEPLPSNKDGQDDVS